MSQISKSRRQVLISSAAFAGAATWGGLWVTQANAYADYLLSATQGTILTGGDIDVDFIFSGLPSGAINSGCILGFMAHTSNSNNLRVHGILNDAATTPFYQYGPTDTNITRFFQEVFSGLRFAPQSNKITFRIVGGTGSFTIREPIIWLRRP